MNNIHLLSENDMLTFAGQLANVVENGTIIFLCGPLGVGKTTFARGFLRGLGYTDKVKSPTYTLVEPYEIEGRTIFHFDFYRLKEANELEHMGIRDYFSPTAICLVEWPEKGFPLLPAPDLACHLSFADEGEGRDIRLEVHSTQGRSILQRL